MGMGHTSAESRHRSARALRAVLAAGAIAVAAVTVGTGTAYAHDSVASSTPAVGSVVGQPPRTVTIRFDGTVIRASAEITNSCGETVPTRVAVSGPTVSVALGSAVAGRGTTRRAVAQSDDAAGAGQWAVRWQAVGSDGHLTSGHVPFSVHGTACGTAVTVPDGSETVVLGAADSVAGDTPATTRIPTLIVGAAILTLLVLLAVAIARRRPGQIRP
jgi:methionine-rich copper-binding protein CopC